MRVAYRTLARQHHPDAKGEASAVRMAEINEAWRVLSDPARRAVYDAHTQPSSAGRTFSAGSAAGASRMAPPSVRPQQIVAPAKFPWRFMLVLATLGIGFVLINAALTKPPKERPPDNLIVAGSCVDIAPNGDAVEVQCTGGNDGVVVEFRDPDRTCPQDTEEHRDHQGMGQVCVRLTTPAGG
jgi:hypothetical protein